MGTLLVVPIALTAIPTLGLCVAIAWLLGWVGALRLRVRLLEAREQESLATADAFADASRRSPEAVFAMLDERLRALDPAIDATLIYLPRGNELACAFTRGARAEAFRGSTLDITGPRAVARAVRKRHRIVCGEDSLLPADRDALAIPLCDGDAVLAVVHLGCARASISDADGLTRLVSRAAPAYALAVERARHVRDATFDGLTGLLAPQAFRNRLREAIDAADPRAHLSLWFIDTDAFKVVNDTLGHAAGDAVLAQMADLLRANAVGGLVARNGGDEFCALLSGVPKSNAIERAETFRAAVAAHDFSIGHSLSASVGVAAYPLDADSASMLLECADAAMYHSKQSGRNRVSYAVGPGSFAVRAEAGSTSA